MNHYFTHFDKLFSELQGDFEPNSHPHPQRVKDTCRLPKYPVSNCYLSEDQNSLHFEFALAGYKEKEVKVIGGKNSFTIRAAKEESPNSMGSTGATHLLLHHGISGKDIDFSIKVDEQYDTKKAKVAYENGLLSVTVPKAKEAESVILFG